ncbi:hypothetical protein Q766_08940 [Flavobacterium subsaxonicum WB 4.1-42 = DSM 21790]|uniref:Uncharacterized protein n=2 Tax=Flavobacterium TaxID=237 RepID=A0A0A2MYV9_9FLAO|nr:hypothetical protein Q766_08940 [Flavobacterium subsaxonicum WB 4.1-42 = DSM 21790]
MLVLIQIVIFIRLEARSRMFEQNCYLVTVGMPLNEARKIMGDLDFQYWTQDEQSAEIIIYPFNGENLYYLSYPSSFGASEEAKIYFDPNTLLVTEVFYGE